MGYLHGLKGLPPDNVLITKGKMSSKMERFGGKHLNQVIKLYISNGTNLFSVPSDMMQQEII